MAISFAPMRKYMQDHKISYYSLANQGIDPQTLQRIRHDKPISTETLEKICRILNCQPGELLELTDDTDSLQP